MSKLLRGLNLIDEITHPISQRKATPPTGYKRDWWTIPYTILAIAGSLGGLFLMWWNGR
jgi:hypothetical protein